MSAADTREDRRDVPVREYMTSPAHVLAAGSSLADAFELTRRHGIRHVPIVDSEERLVGVLSDRELHIAKRERGITPEDVLVDEMMARPPYTVTPDTPLEEAARVMGLRKLGCAVVVEGGHVVGVVTTTDTLRALVELRGHGGGVGDAR